MADMILMWGVRFAAQPVLRVDVNGSGGEDVTLLTTAGTDYFFTGDGQADDLITVLCAAIETHSVGPTCTASISSNWKSRTQVTLATHQLLWSHV
ncbi:MAG: hypothetical protein GY778_01095, partial [bacterium]|nr:hypothetical protein [bacterium]